MALIPDNPPPDKTAMIPGSAAVATGRPQIPDHELIRPIGGGSYGEVWLARNVMGSFRAVKVVYRKTFESERPYEREFSGIKKFEPISRSHEGFVDILQVGRNDQAGYFYYVMELADDAGGLQVERESELRVGGGATHDAASQLSTQTPLNYSPKTLRSEVTRRGRLPIEECLQLSLSLTSALGQLHKQGLIHRDIKPSNIIFVHGQPKLADIGLVASMTEARSYVGTEGFIPPEGPGTAQADLYSLGKVLYEISTGKDRTDFPELPTLVREMPDREKLVEFNEVVLKACQNNLQYRYQSAEEMHADLALLQSGKSVKHLRLMERRLAWITRTGATALMLALIAGGAFWFQKVEAGRALEASQKEQKLRQEAESERQRAVAAEKAERQLRQKAEAEERNSEAEGRLMQRFIEEIFRTASGHDTALRGILEETAERLANDPKKTPEMEADIRKMMGVFYLEVRDFKKAESMQREALETFRRLGNEKEVAESLDLLAVTLDSQNKSTEAEPVHREAVDIYRKVGDERGIAMALKRRGDGFQAQKKFAEAESMYQQALAVRRQFGENDGTAYALNDLGEAQLEMKKFVEAETSFREALEVWRKLNYERGMAAMLERLHTALHGQDKLPEAEIALRECLVLHRKLDHTNEVVALRNHLVDMLRRDGSYDEAERLFNDELTAEVQKGPQSASILRDRAEFFARRGKWKQASADLTKVIEFNPKDHVPYHMLAPLLVAGQEIESYQKLCQKILHEFSGTTSASVADRMAKDCLILSASGADLNAVGRLADVAVTAGKSQSAFPYFQFCKALAEYRQSNFASAVEWMQRSIKNRSFPNDTNRFVEAYMVLAMAEHQLKHADEARAAFGKGTQMADQLQKLESGDIGTGWRDWIIAHALMNEAKALLENKPAAASDHPQCK